MSAVSIHEKMRIENIVGLLQKKHLIRVPVMDDEDRLIGILARWDSLGRYIE